MTDFVYKTATGPVLHTIAFGTRVRPPDRPVAAQFRPVSPGQSDLRPLSSSIRSTRPISVRLPSTTLPATPTASTAQHRVGLCPGSDRIDALPAIAGRRSLRQFRSDGAGFEYQPPNRARVDDFISSRAAVIVKPIDSVSLYTAWSVSYLPASGDQFSALIIPAPSFLSRKGSRARRSARNGTSIRSCC